MASPSEGPMASPSDVNMATSQLGHSEAEVVAVKPKAKDHSPSYSREDTRILDRRVTNNTKSNCIRTPPVPVPCVSSGGASTNFDLYYFNPPWTEQTGTALISEHSTAASALSPVSKLKIFLYLFYLLPPVLNAQQTASHYLLSALVLLFVIGGGQDQEAGEGI